VSQVGIYIPEDGILHSHRCENLRCHIESPQLEESVSLLGFQLDISVAQGATVPPRALVKHLLNWQALSLLLQLGNE
jgi:hypothetical protein